jgi:hypothetical protein
MIKLQSIYKQLISESRRKEVIEKYRDRYSNGEDFEQGSNLYDMGFNSYEHLVDLYEKHLPHPKYLDYALNYSCCGNYGGSPVDIDNLLRNFHRLSEKGYIENKDIYSPEYKITEDSMGFARAENLINVVEEAMKLEEIKEKEKELQKDVDKIYEDSRWRVVVPKSHKASCYYGAGTKWCTTSKDNPNYFKTYTNKAVLFYLIDKTNTQDNSDIYKIAINWQWGYGEKDGLDNMRIPKGMLDNSTWYDAKDDTINKVHIIPLLPEKLIDSLYSYYEGNIQSYNKKRKEELRGPSLSFDEIREEFIKRGFNQKVINKFNNNLPNENLLNVNGGIDDIHSNVIEGIGYYSFVVGDSQHIYSIATLGSSEMVGNPQLYEIFVNDEDGDQSWFGEELFDDYYMWYRILSNLGFGGYGLSKSSINNTLYKAQNYIYDNLDVFVDYIYNRLISVIRNNEWSGPSRRNDYQSYKEEDGIVYWKPVNTSSSYSFKYPPKSGGLTEEFLNAVKENPGITPKEFYTNKGFRYYSGYNSHFFGSLRDSGIVRREKGRYGEYKYYLGPNYRKWTQGRLKRL